MEYSTIKSMFESAKAMADAGSAVSYELYSHSNLIERDQKARDELYSLFDSSVDLDEPNCLSYIQRQKLRDLSCYMLPGAPRNLRCIIEEAVEDVINKPSRISDQKETHKYNNKRISDLIDQNDEQIKKIAELEVSIEEYKSMYSSVREVSENALDSNSKLKDHNDTLIKCNDEQQKIILGLKQTIDGQVNVITQKDIEIQSLNKQLFGEIIPQVPLKSALDLLIDASMEDDKI